MQILVCSLGGKDTTEKEMATLSSILAWKISWTEEPRGLQAIGSQRVRHTGHAGAQALEILYFILMNNSNRYFDKANSSWNNERKSHKISLARILERVAIPFSSGSSRPLDWTWVSYIAGRFFTIWATREALIAITSSCKTLIHFKMWI